MAVRRKIGLRALRRRPLATLMVVIRLTLTEPLVPVFWKLHLQRFFPPARKTVYKKGLADYFFRN
ncbi:MAG: hypothetical protein D6715_10090 [Calditrichaeota bacterium]|nr:MAG: hypothetical protein D6715_10090 [Calditrichota bacterium]